MAAHNSTKHGTLVIAGSGIASVAHITLETASHIKEADKIFYVVCDPVTEAFIQDNAKGPCFDLTVYYDSAKHRYDSYVQMCEVILRGVREGHNVLGIFYGHPGVFVSPSHRAIAMARQEGYEARMLPGVSAEDYLFADLEFDPAMYGCMSCEANELLLTNRPLNPLTHNIIWQVGSVGVTTLQFDNSRFHLLVDHIEKDFGPDHRVVHYIGAVLPQFDTIINTFTIADLRKEDVVKKFNAISTLYIPPRDTNSTHSTTALGSDASLESIRPLMRWDGPKPTFVPANGPRERDIIAQLDNHVTPEGYRTLHISPAMKKFMTDLALKPKLLKEYKAKPLAVVESMEGLTELEKFGLKLGEEGPAYALMTATQSDIANGRELTKDEIANISRPLGLGTVLVTAVLIAVILVS